MAYEVKRTGSRDYGRFVKLLNCGEPGSGKTLTASTWPNPLYLNAEAGLLSIRDKDLPAIDVTDLAMLLEVRDDLLKPQSKRPKSLDYPIETVCIDTIDEVGRMIIKERLASSNKEGFAPQDWGWYGEQLRDLVRGYRNLPMNVIFNCHLKAQTDEETGKMFIKPAIQGAMGDEIAGYVDIAVVMTARPQTEVVEGKNARRIVRVMQTTPDSRQPWVKDRSGKLPMEFPINFKDDHKRLDALVFGQGRPAEVQEPVLPPEQADSVVAEAEEVVAAAPKKRAATKKAAPAKQAEKADEPPKEKEERPASDPQVNEQPKPDDEPSWFDGQPEPAPEEGADEVVDVRDPAPEVSVSDAETAAPVDDSLVCEDCQGEIHTKDQADLSRIRFRRRLCKECMKQARAKK